MCYSAGSSLDGTIYSIALAGNGDKSSSDFAPSVQTAHEGTRALLRDMVLAGTEEEGGGLVPALLCTEVRPYAQYDGDGHGDGNGVADDARDSVQIRRGSYHTMRVRRISATLPRGVGAPPPLDSPTTVLLAVEWGGGLGHRRPSQLAGPG